ncbi:HTH-type transcriptional regulator HdfR (plasmid) [Ralstonia syzygii]
MQTISLHHLHVFAGVSAAGGVRRASETLHRASSAIARSVAALEAALGVALFERKGRGMLLTRAGEIVLLRAQQIEAALREVREDAVRTRQSRPVAGLEALHNERRLEVAALLCEVHHMPSVAAALGISQSAVSQAIARLEDTLAQPLFARTARGMVPTDAGSRWIVRFERVLSELRHIHADIAALQGVLEGTVTIGALPLGRTQLLPGGHRGGPRAASPAALPFAGEPLRGADGGAAERPHRLHPRRAASPAFAGPDHRSAVRGPHLDHRARIAPARRQEAAGPAGPGGLSVGALACRLAAARSARCGVYPPGLPQPQPLVETGDLALVRGLLLRGDMITALSAHQLHYEIEAGWLRALDLPMPDMARGIGITTRMGARLSPGADALLAEIRRLAQAWR